MQGAVGTSSIGELWCSYEIELYKPQFIEDAATQTAYWDYNQPFAPGLNPTPFFNTINNNQPFGTLPNAIPCWAERSNVKEIDFFLNPATKRINFNDNVAKRLQITCIWRFGAAATVTLPPAFVNYTGCKLVKWVNQSVGGFNSPPASTTITATDWNMSCSTIVECTADRSYVELSGFTFSGAFPGLSAFLS